MNNRYVRGALGVALPLVDSVIGLFNPRKEYTDYAWWLKAGSRTGTIVFAVTLTIAMIAPIPGLSFLVVGAKLLASYGIPILAAKIATVVVGIGVGRAVGTAVGATIDHCRLAYNLHGHTNLVQLAGHSLLRALKVMFVGEVALKPKQSTQLDSNSVAPSAGYSVSSSFHAASSQLVGDEQKKKSVPYPSRSGSESPSSLVRHSSFSQGSNGGDPRVTTDKRPEQNNAWVKRLGAKLGF